MTRPTRRSRLRQAIAAVSAADLVGCGSAGTPKTTDDDPEHWCNPPGRRLGEAPTTSPELPRVDALLWVKQPGDSDGSCRGAPPAGTWWPPAALELAGAGS